MKFDETIVISTSGRIFCSILKSLNFSIDSITEKIKSKQKKNLIQIQLRLKNVQMQMHLKHNLQLLRTDHLVGSIFTLVEETTVLADDSAANNSI